ncbi:MAG: UDP-N-acetylmuramyl peptide synthase, partial [Treponema sp.]|nr:UDP-N-acetylmuramyl peptide synthase [Treponema sp.]
MTKNLFDTLSSIKYTVVASDGKTPLSQKDTPNPEISSLVFDSRDVKPGSLFFALPGTHTTGNVFIPKAIENGASAIVFEAGSDGEAGKTLEESFERVSVKAMPEPRPNSKTPVFIRVENARKVMAPVAASFYDNPSSKLGIIGVTGTEGKSSTVSFVWQLLRLTGHKAGFISTVQYSLGDEAIANPQHQTTPEATIIQRQLYEMVENGCEYAVVETS